MGKEQIELGGITLTDKTKDGEEKKVNAGEIVADVIAEKIKEQEKLKAERRNKWKKFKQETAEINPDLLEETGEELVAGKYGFNPDGTKREERKDMPNSHKKIDAKKFKKVGGRRDASDKFNVSNEFNEPEYPSQKTETVAERQAEEKIENPKLAEKINEMVELSGRLWDLFQRLENIKKKTSEPELSLEGNNEQKEQLREKKDEINKIYDDINKTSQELVILYYRDIKKEMDNPNIVYKIEGISEEDAKRARGAIGRIEEGKTYIKEMDIENGREINKIVDIWGRNGTKLRIEKREEPEYKITYFDPDNEYVELKNEAGNKEKFRSLDLYIMNYDKIKAEKEKEAIEKINKIEPEDISGQSFEKLAEIKDKRKEEEILTVFKDRKTLLRIKENAKREYVLVTYNPGAEYSYVETPEGKNRQRVRSKDVYALNADVIGNIEKADAEVAK